MPYSKDDLMVMAVNSGSKIPKQKDVEVIIIFYDPVSDSVGWASTIAKSDMLSVVSDVLDTIICQMEE